MTYVPELLAPERQLQELERPQARDRQRAVGGDCKPDGNWSGYAAPHSQRRATSWCSVSRTVIGRRSNTWRRSTPTCGAPLRSTPQLVAQRFVGIGDLRQRRTAMARLPARLASTLAAQRPRGGFAAGDLASEAGALVG